MSNLLLFIKNSATENVYINNSLDFASEFFH